MCEAEADVEARNWEKRNSDIALHEINQEFESQRFHLHQASRWADQAQRDQISLHGDLELRSKLQSKFLVRHKEFFYDPETASSSAANPRSQSTLCNSDFQNHALPRFWIAA